MVGFLTRAHLAIRLSFPRHQSQKAVARLVAVSLAMGLGRFILKPALKKLASKYPKVLDNNFHGMLVHALMTQDVWTIYSLGE